MSGPNGNGDADARIARLERLVQAIARGVLLHEYAKDLSRDGVEAILLEVSDGDLDAALKVAREADGE